ncbi:hypothetical protein L2E82_20915 [Cichorium intybus]|uniref:Uncharacterized protein n=1 Tax=Cichorium intybus TaxID=13427 RepID=A0ACB9DVM1_CICIN|nr:hypothetical protein L2E82_20915 [Cichorium intybus]
MALRAPVGGLSIASTTSASLQDSSTRTRFCRIPSYRTSFLGSGGLRLAHTRNTRCYIHGVIQMNLFDRFARVVKVLASQKQLENKYKAGEQASKDWYKRAQLALGIGDEDLARQDLKRRKCYAATYFHFADGSLREPTSDEVDRSYILMVSLEPPDLLGLDRKMASIAPWYADKLIKSYTFSFIQSSNL